MNYQSKAKAIIKVLTGQENMLTTPRELVRFMGNSLSGGIFLSQLLYWSGKCPEDHFFYKTTKEWYEEICVSRRQIEKHSKFLISLGILETKVKKVREQGGDTILHYRIDWKCFEEHFVKFVEDREEKEKRKKEEEKTNTNGGRSDGNKGNPECTNGHSLGMYKRAFRDVRMGIPSKDIDYGQRLQTETTSGGRSVAPAQNGSLLPRDDMKSSRHSPFDLEAARRLKKIIVENEETSLLNVRESTLAERVRRLRERAGVSEERIRKWISWLREHYADEDVAHFRRADDVFDHFKRHEDAMKRKSKSSSNGNLARLSNGRVITGDNMYESENCYMGGVPSVWADYDGKQYDGRIVYKVQKACRKRYGDRMYLTEEQVNDVLEELGLEKGSIPPGVAACT